MAGGAGLTIDALSDRYSEQLEAHEDDYLVPGPEPAADARRLHESEDHANVIYGRVAPRAEGGRWLQYWFFYFMSAKGVPGVRSATGPLGFGLHEGDWEMIQIAVPEDGGTPVAATYAAHDHGHSIAWERWSSSRGGRAGRVRGAELARVLPARGGGRGRSSWVSSASMCWTTGATGAARG